MLADPDLHEDRTIAFRAGNERMLQAVLDPEAARPVATSFDGRLLAEIAS